MQYTIIGALLLDLFEKCYKRYKIQHHNILRLSGTIKLGTLEIDLLKTCYGHVITKELICQH